MKPIRSRHGFTVVEVLIAMSVLLVGLTASAALITRTIEKGASARKITEGQLVAQQVLERLRAEVRVDAEPSGGSCNQADANQGCVAGAKFEPAQAWKAERLPYSTVDVAAGAGSCNPDGANDGVTYDVGPLPIDHEGNRFLVCYRLEPSAAAGVPLNSVDARIKVLWRVPGGWGATWLSAILLDGR